MPVMLALDKHLMNRKTLCFLDLEGTQFTHEMIAIGAVKVSIRKDGSIKKIHKGYYTLVKAKNRVGSVVTELTGLTDKMLKEKGVSFRTAVDNLKKYMGKDFTKTLYVTFGNHDVRIISQSLAHNLDAKKSDVEVLIKHNFDLAEFLNTYLKDDKNNNLSLAHMLEKFKVEFKGTQHNALADALNLAYLYGAFLKNKEILKVEYRKTLGMYRHLPDPIHRAVERLAKGETVTPEEFDEYIVDSIK